MHGRDLKVVMGLVAATALTFGFAWGGRAEPPVGAPRSYPSPKWVSCYSSLEARTPRVKRPTKCIVLTGSGDFLGRIRLTHMRWESWATTATGVGKAQQLGGWSNRRLPVKVTLRSQTMAVKPNGTQVLVYSQIKVEYTTVNVMARWQPILN